MADFASKMAVLPDANRVQWSAMATNNSAFNKHSVQTASGRISYTDEGAGPVALFVHGVLLNGYLWRHQQAGLADMRRTIAVDLLSLIHISEPTRQAEISYAVFCLK